MSTLYAFINQTQYDVWAKETSICEPSVERFLREVGTTRIKYSNDVLVKPYVVVKSGGGVKIIQKYPTLQVKEDTVEQETHKHHGFVCRIKKIFGLKH